MKSYPEIPGPSGGHHEKCYAFHKYDGSNLRFEWSPKRGWYKFGTRNCLINETDSVFGPAIPLFIQKYGDDLEKVFKKDKLFRGVQNVIVFAEYFGSKSFAGMHFPDDTQWDVVLFDVNPHKKGILGPKEFLDTFGHLAVAELVYEGNFGPWLIDAVRGETIDLVSKYPIRTEVPEGVVCKGICKAKGKSNPLWFCKVKTERYKQELRRRYQVDWIKYWE